MSAVLLFSLTAIAAEDETADVPQEPAPEVDLDDSKLAPGLTTKQHRFLKPKRHKLPQNPYAQTDFTAYTVEFLELKLGLTNVQFGLIPRVQVGTSPLLDLLGIYNVNAKINPVRVGPLDLSVLGQYHTIPLGDFQGSYLGGGAGMSLRLTPGWSVHGGGYYGRLSARGIPSAPPALFRSYLPADTLADWQTLATTASEFGVDPQLTAAATLLRLATDVRLNRRDSFVLQFQAMTTGSVSSDLGDLGENEEFVGDLIATAIPFASSIDLNEQRRFGLLDAYALTLSYQLSFKTIDLRMGGGHSTDGLAWLWQGNEVAWRVGGKTRRDDTRRKRTWRKDRKKIDKQK